MTPGKRQSLTLAVMALAVLISLAGFIARRSGVIGRRPTASPAAPVELAAGVTARVDHIVDGDTVDVVFDGAGGGERRERIRLLSVNTPEFGQPGYDEATAALRELIRGKTVTLEPESPETGFIRGGFGRILAYLFDGDRNVNLEIVRLGWSPYWTKFGPGRYPAAFRAAEAEARGKKRGLWRR